MIALLALAVGERDEVVLALLGDRSAGQRAPVREERALPRPARRRSRSRARSDGHRSRLPHVPPDHPARRRSSRRAGPSAPSRRTACCATASGRRTGRPSRRAVGSKSVTSAGEPGASVPPGRPKARAGPAEKSAAKARRARACPAARAGRARAAAAVSRPDDPERRRVEVERLLVLVVRRVVGRDRVDRAVREPRHERLDVRGLAQRRVHLVRWSRSRSARPPRRSATGGAA